MAKNTVEVMNTLVENIVRKTLIDSQPTDKDKRIMEETLVVYEKYGIQPSKIMAFGMELKLVTDRINAEFADSEED